MVTIALPDAVGARLAAEAARRGVDTSEYASQLLARALAAPSIDEVLAPFRKQVAASGLSDEQLDGLFEEARDESWRARRDSAS